MSAALAVLGALIGAGVAAGIQLVPRWHRADGGPNWPFVRAALAALGTALFFALAAARHPPGLGLLAALVLGAAFIALFLIDAETRLLPDAITGPAAVFALATSFGTIGPGSSLIAGVVCLLIFLAFFLVARGGFGFGDVKLAALIGLAGGWPAGLQGLFAGVVLGGVVSVALLVARVTTLKSYIPYGPFLAVGGLVALLLSSG